eukprot:Tamp_28436.p1 GENE.Tamp_28436~~Tamp_28436.p1  ORF type:complete len:133 (-),score=7.43 Tamp_28436:49-447(-)
MNAYLDQHKLTQRVKILFAHNAGEHESLDLEEFITKLNILHLSSIAGSQYQNTLAEYVGGWRLGNVILHDFDMSFLSFCFLHVPRPCHGPGTGLVYIYIQCNDTECFLLLERERERGRAFFLECVLASNEDT